MTLIVKFWHFLTLPHCHNWYCRTVHVALSKQPINYFNIVMQNKQQVQRPYCPNIKTVLLWLPDC